MKKFILLMCVAVSQIVVAQFVDEGPTNDAPSILNKALFDFEFGYDIGALGTIGENDLAGVIFINNQYWVAEWDSPLIHVLDTDGILVETFSIPGIVGARSFTSDGTNIYTGKAQGQIYIVDPVTRMMTGEIQVNTTSNATARMVAYDPTLDNGNGGFWIGSFSTDIASLDMGGNELSVIPTEDHGTVVYGGAVDFVTPGGPYLWIHDLSGIEPEQDFITQIDLATGTPTGVVFNFLDIAPMFGSDDLNAGGLFITNEVTSGQISMVGVCQCQPSNILFSLNVADDVLAANDTTLSNFSLYPNPTNTGLVEIKTALSAEIEVVVYDVFGKKVLSAEINNSLLDVKSLTSGVYIVQVTQEGKTAQKKLIVGR